MIITDIKRSLYMMGSLLIILISTGCANDFPTGNNPQNEIKNFTLRIHRNIVDPETELTTLRLLIYDAADLSLVANTLFSPENTYNAIDQKYILHTQLKGVDKIRYFVVANEPSSWTLDQGKSYNDLKKLSIHYYDLAANRSKVTPPFLMIAPHEEDVTLSKTQDNIQDEILVRNVVKVVLNLQQELSQANAPSAPITIQKAYIENVPRYGFFSTGSAYAPSELYTQTTEQLFTDTDFELSENHSTLKNSAIFYIPEHLLTDKANYSSLLIKGITHIGAEVSYQIPLGRGADKLYDPVNPVTIDALNADDLSFDRNTCFRIDALIRFNQINAVLSVKEWTEKQIEGTIDDPYLNISSLEEWFTVSNTANGTETIINNGQLVTISTFPTIPEKFIFYFWTNLPKEELKLSEYITLKNNPDPVLINTLFNYDSVITEEETGFIPGVKTITMRLELLPQNGSRLVSDSYQFTISAGHLTRTFYLRKSIINP